MFINCSNHPSQKWGQKQTEEVNRLYGEVMDYEFPAVNPMSTKEEVMEIARKMTEEICELKPDAVLCQGEFTLVYHIVEYLKKANIVVVAACSKRILVEEQSKEGDIVKTVKFVFEQLREY